MKKQMVVYSSIFALSLASSMAFAGPHHGKVKFLSMFDSNKDNMVTLDELQAAGKDRFQGMDKDANGTVSEEEFSMHIGEHHGDYKQKRFENVDTNGDGQISLDEFVEYKRAKAEKYFAKKDENGDGVLSAEEFASRSKGHHGHQWGQGHHGGKHGNWLFKKLDVNGDGGITEEEALKVWHDWFKKLDTDNNQTVTEEEASQAWRGHHQKPV